MPVDAADTIVALAKLGIKVDAATEHFTAEVAQEAQKNVRTFAPKGIPGNTTDPPGHLAESTIVQGPKAYGAHVWMAKVGPTVRYTRQRALGGPITPKSASILRFEKFGVTYYRPRVYQHPNPFMQLALARTEKQAGRIARRVILEVIGG
jgi:hypothetical protein